MLPANRYHPNNRPALIARLADVITELVAAYDEDRTSEIAEEQSYLDGMQHSTADSVAGQQRDGRYARFATWSAGRDVKATIRQLQEERDLLNRLLDMGENGAGD